MIRINSLVLTEEQFNEFIAALAVGQKIITTNQDYVRVIMHEMSKLDDS